ncbi:Hypothetical protein PHPALM_6329 [Phytophthora palmivora]|uniref:PiggyBac transposable element-derived protein domain-containing protein n=1 Tax=Phytophthora palmivora TaxID=4796 RepID=A0A2P4YF32_9STRA|nr:Hypothetical protein PHPALM_6329 [Phytophthora palmivora]
MSRNIFKLLLTQMGCCVRLEIYCGKANSNEDSVTQRAVYCEGSRHSDSFAPNFNTSIPLSDKPLSMGHYHVGTIRKDRKGWCKAIEFKQKKRPKRTPRETYHIAVSRDRPHFVALAWMDSKPVRFLATNSRLKLHAHVLFEIITRQ